MDIERLEELLNPWLRVDTWHTAHILDDQRFHRALKQAYEELGTDIHSGDVILAIENTLNKRSPELKEAYSEAIKRYAGKAQQIGWYVRDTQ
jgi:glycine/D-amino acid oxidase-like deaminating enzyme